MARRKALSAELDPRIRQLVAQLRQLKDHTGLSTRQLAAKTGYSEKSWERYLLGRSLPPREAVEALSRIGGVDPVRLLALHEVAAAAWGDRRVNLSAPEGPAGPEPSAEPAAEAAQAGHARLLVSPSLRVALVAGVVALVLAVSSTVLLVLRLDDDSGDPVAAPPGSSSTAGRSSPAPVYSCRIKQIAGLWYAGISRTRTAGLATGDAGPDVAEAQCLLRRAGISPGGIDGIFGPLTRRAVRAVQKRSGLEVDGMIGPHTWKVLRG